MQKEEGIEYLSFFQGCEEAYIHTPVPRFSWGLAATSDIRLLWLSRLAGLVRLQCQELLAQLTLPLAAGALTGWILTEGYCFNGFDMVKWI